MKTLISAVSLTVMIASASSSAKTDSDIRGLYVNESHVQHLPKVASSTTTEHIADVVVFYQPSYFAEYGAYEAHKRIEAWVATANKSYHPHGFSHYRLSVSDIIPVESVSDEVPYQSVQDSDGNITRGADFLFSVAVLNEFKLVDGEFIENHEYNLYQKKWKGDLVVYVREMRPEDNVYGLASIGGESSSLIDNNKDPEQYTTLAHEIGHNLGMNHQESDAHVGPAYARATRCGGKYTIMYAGSPDELELYHYSSPALFSNGEVCGDEEKADNARILEENFVATTQRREGVEALGKVTFSGSTFSGNEENGVVLTLERDGDLSQAASVKVFAENDTAVWGEDFVDAFVLAEFAVGEATTDIIFPMIEDGESEGTELLSVTLKYSYKLAIGDTSSATLSVADGAKTGSAGMFSLSGPSELNEGDTGTYVVTRVGGVAEVVMNIIAVSDIALAGSDYIALNKQLVFAEGEVEKSATLVTVDNQKAETKEGLAIEISSPNETAEYDVKSISVAINDDDKAGPYAGKFALSASETTVSESAGSVTLTITRREGFTGRASVRVYTVAGSAIAGVDFTAFNKELFFIDGETERSLTLQILDDSDDEAGNTSFDVVLEGAGVEVTTSKVTITLTDNDDANSDDADGENGSGSTGIGFMLLLLLLIVFRFSRFNDNKKFIRERLL